MSGGFVHLHLHTEFSIVDGLVRIKPLMKALAAAGMPAVALTDQSNLFAMVKFYRAALAAGIKPIIGVELQISPDDERNPPTRLILLCQDREGYLNLNRLITRSYTEGQHRGIPMIERDWLHGATDGLIALSGGRAGDIGQALIAGDKQQAGTLLDDWSGLFPDRFYLELVRTGREQEETYLHAAVELALEKNIPVVASNDVRFIKRSDFESHEARVCIQEGRTLNDSRRQHLYSEEQYLRSSEEMEELFSDIPEAIENTRAIAQRCNMELRLGEYFLPDFPVPDGLTIEAFLTSESERGLDARIKQLEPVKGVFSEEKRQAYKDRLKLELDVIISMGFPGYFLIVADFIRWARNNDVPVGPGRGSGAGSIVAYALGITDLDPIEYDLLFERFLNPERVSMPDFDVDFCMEGRDRVIDYVARHYGRDKVSQIITYGTMAAKAVIRDAGRVLGHPYGFVDQIAKLIPFEIGITLDKALEQEEELRRRYEDDEEVHALIELGRSLEGITRNAGKHAGGVVIAPTALTDFLPLYCEEGAESIVSQLDKDDVEAIGLVKFDFLGLRTLTIIDWAVKTVNRERERNGEAALVLEQLPMDDKKTFDLLKACETTAVFQLESRGMKELIKNLKPDNFEEIIALVALFRPGPLESGMVDDFISRKHKRTKVEYPFAELEEVLAPTYGVIVYQEQVMQISQIIGNYSLGSADLLRRAMGKKKPAEMAKQRGIFMSGASELGFDEKKAGDLFDLMEKFAGYGFNKSHSAAYALVSYHTAWLKAHYPAAFMAAVLSSDMDNTDKVVMLIDECRHMQLEVLPPNVNNCEYMFTSQGDKSIYYGLGAIKGVGEAALESIVQERNENGLYADLFDFCRRIDPRKVNRRVLEAMIRAGALDGMAPNRATLMANLSVAMKSAEQHLRNEDQGIDDMFGGPAAEAEVIELKVAPEWPEKERLEGEKDTLGLYLTGHPITQYEKELERVITSRLVNVQASRDEQTVAGLVVALQTRNTKSGERMGFMTLDDRSGRIEVAAFKDTYKQFQHLIAKDKLLVITGSVREDDYSGGLRLQASQIYDIDEAREAYARQLLIRVDAKQAGNGFLDALEQTLTPFRDGRCPVILDYARADSRARISLGEDWRIRPTDELLQQLQELAGEGKVEVLY
ncbi:DNA polymerase III subunit alpha [Sulfuriflexus mobilis]|uniref:DNA polymerase III subunit alpha n=1 Tax=Sulfuriflexus mobilis TaxID=1811807 RepID=UPI000F83FCEA|nr:DNA polymerase III subunit alpha [Sulfuriflexus mobilis]